MAFRGSTDSVSREINSMRVQIMAELKEYIKNEINRSMALMRDGIMHEVHMMNASGQLVTQPKNELATANRVYNMVVKEMHETIVPKISQLEEKINYHTQDTDGLVDAYRRKVDESYSGGKYLTNGRDPRIVGSHVRLFFGDE